MFLAVKGESMISNLLDLMMAYHLADLVGILRQVPALLKWLHLLVRIVILVLSIAS